MHFMQYYIITQYYYTHTYTIFSLRLNKTIIYKVIYKVVTHSYIDFVVVVDSFIRVSQPR